MANSSNNAPATGDNSQKVANQVVDMLANAGIKHIYAITGDSLNDLTDAIGKDGRIKFVHMRHEESGAFAACAEAQLTGKLACCAGSSGPGHIHLINGLYDAQRSGAPVLAIASTCPTIGYGAGYFQETNPTLLFSNCSVYNEPATLPIQVPKMLQAAMQEAVSKGGVGIVSLPADVLGKPAKQPSSSVNLLSTDRIPLPSNEEIGKCADLINNAKSVAIYAGCGAAKAKPLLLELANKLKAPVATTFKSQMMLAGDCPNYVGHIGYLGHYSAIEAIESADVILILGMNFPFPGCFPTDKKIIQVDINASRLGRVAKVDMGVRADIGEFLKALLPEISPKTDDSFLNNALAKYAEILKKLQLPIENPGVKYNIRPEYVMYLLDKLADDNCVFTVDTGMNCVWSAHFLTPSKDRKMVGSFTHGSMANAMPMAIGAVMACPDRQIISLSGDGGFTMLLGDLLTIVQYQLPVKILVADNRALAYVKWEMELAGFSPSEVNLTNPDFGAMARSMGLQAETVEEPSQLEEAMKRWLSAKGPALLSVCTDQNAASFTFSREMVDNAKPGNNISNFMLPGSI